MNRESLEGLIAAWVDRDWLRPLDRALMHFIDALAPESHPLLLLATALASHQLGRGHSCLDLEMTLALPDETLSLPPLGEAEGGMPVLPSQILAEQSLREWRQIITASPAVAAGAGDTPLVLLGNRLYLRRYWQYEQSVARAIGLRLQKTFPVPSGLPERLERLFPKQEGMPVDWQKVACALAIRGGFTIITGGPGTGKTTTVVKLLALLQDAARQQEEKLRIRLAAPTGKAAARLTESIGKALARLPAGMAESVPSEATTLHRLLGARPDTRHFRHHADNPLHADWVVVDEASMIDLEMMAALLTALRPETRLVLLGDKDQLASVEAGAVLGELCREAGARSYSPATVAWLAEATGENLGGYQGASHALGQQIAVLRTSHRFGENSGIGQLALAVNSGDAVAVGRIWQQHPPYPDIARLGLQEQAGEVLENVAVEGGRAHFPAQGLCGMRGPSGYRDYLEVLHGRRPTPHAPESEWQLWGKSVLAAFDQFQLLCALRRGPLGVEGLNAQIAAMLHKLGLVKQVRGWYEGRPVMVTRNDYRLGLMNGDIGIALNFPEPDRPKTGATRLRVAFLQADHSLKLVLPSQINEVETVYAMTVHKSQGSEFDHVALLLPDKANPVLTRELVYTGITRAKDWFTLLAANPAMLAHAVANPVRRSGGLADCLSEQCRQG